MDYIIAMLLFFHLPTLTKTLLISLIALLTLIGIMVRPFKLNEAMIAMAGAALLLIIGLIDPLDALTTLTGDWNTFFFFLGMMSLSALAEAAGLYHRLGIAGTPLAGPFSALSGACLLLYVHEPHNAIWALADSSLRRNELWSRSSRYHGSSNWYQFDQ